MTDAKCARPPCRNPAVPYRSYAGHCSIECRDLHEAEQERDEALARIAELERERDELRAFVGVAIEDDLHGSGCARRLYDEDIAARAGLTCNCGLDEARRRWAGEKK